MYTECSSECLKGTDDLEDLIIYGRIILKLILKKQGGRMWSGFICLRIGTSAIMGL
jgi:hypothetical protein